MKGFFTQCACVLLDKAHSLDAIERLLGAFRVVGRRPAVEGWIYGGEEIALEFRPDVNGYVMVDMVDAPWPDAMGDPEAQDDLFEAWRLGHFGPFTYPDALARAVQQSWRWPDAPVVAASHQAFVRIRSTYTAGGDGSPPALPPRYNPLTELILVTDVARALLGLDGALAYFNPNGEALRSRALVERALQRFATGGPPPLDVWTNQRQFRFGPENGWLLVDTVGLRQLDIADQEAVFVQDRYTFGQVGNLLLNAAQYMLARGPVIKAGDTIPMGRVRWEAHVVETAQLDPPRPAIRWQPMDGSTPPPDLLALTP
jgi:hypothetical protein